MTEQEIIDRLTTALADRPASLRKQAIAMMIESHRNHQQLLRSKGKTLDQVMVMLEENLALLHLVGEGKKCEECKAYIEDACQAWREIIDAGSADDLRIDLMELHEMMKGRG